MNIAFLFLLTVPAADSIDEILAREWQRREIEPAEVCSDDQFLRRVTLDLAGRIPTVSELQQFRENSDRRAKIDELLRSDEFPRFWSEIWTATLNGYSNAFESDREVLRQWLEQTTREGVPYDRVAKQLIAARGVSALDGPVNFLVRHPDEPAVKVTRVFLGVRLDCARCHDHPFDRWTEEDFALMNRFFEATQRREVGEGNIRLDDRRVEVDYDDRPRFLTGARPRTTQWREELALYVTRSKPFARAYVNRVWYHFMGRGIVHPMDDFHRENPPAVPELLAYLTDRIRDEGFDTVELIREICNSRAYQQSSRPASPDAEAAAVFAYRLLKPLTPEQTYDSLMTALDRDRRVDERRRYIRRIVGESLDEDFSDTWTYRESVQDLMRRLNTEFDSLGTDTRLEELYARILSRPPTERDRAICAGRPLQDVAFALLNSNEFFFNH